MRIHPVIGRSDYLPPGSLLNVENELQSGSHFLARSCLLFLKVYFQDVHTGR